MMCHLPALLRETLRELSWRTLNSEVDNGTSEVAKRICVLAILGYDSFFGAERANLQVLRLLRERGALIECVVRDQGAERFVGALRDEGFSLHSARFGPSLFGLYWNPFRYLANLAGMLRVSIAVARAACAKRPTHIYVPNYILFLSALPALFLLRVPVVFRVGDAPLTSPLHRLMWSRFISPRVDVFVSNSAATRECLLDAVGRPVNCRVILNCVVPLGDSKLTKPEIRPSSNAPKHSYIVYIGRISRLKGVDLAVDAAIEICRQWPETVFRFIGLTNAQEVLAVELRQRIAAAGFESRILIENFTEHTAEILETAWLHLSPSLIYESSSNAVIEAKRAGVPSVVFPTGGLPEQVRHTVDGFVCRSCDVQGLIDGILFYLAHPHRLDLARQAAKASISNYAPAEIGNRWFRLFQETE